MECVYQKEDMQILKVSDRVYLRQMDYWKTEQCNSVYIVGDRSVGVVDIARKESGPQLEEEAAALFGKEIRYVFLTHRHADHTEGLPDFLRKPRTVFMAENLYTQLPPAPGCLFTGVRDSLRINMEGVELELFRPAGTMHCSDEMFIRIPREHTVCSGDCAVDFRSFYCLDSHLENWLYGLEHLFREEDRVFLPGHGTVMGKEDIRIMADRIRLLRRMGEAVRAGFSKEAFRALDPAGMEQAARRCLREGGEDARLLKEAAGDMSEEHLVQILRYLQCRGA